MNIDLTTAAIAAAVSLATTGATLGTQGLLARREREHADDRDRVKHEAEVLAVFRKYQAPLLVSADALQSRIYNIVQKRLFELDTGVQAVHQCGRTYAVESTLSLLSEYFGWREAVRREIQFFDTGELESTRRINVILEHVSRTFASSSPPFDNGLVVFRSQQRAVGDLVLVRSDVGGEHWECVGPAKFCELLDSIQGKSWLGALEQQVASFRESLDYRTEQRLRLAQNWLLELVDEADPKSAHVASKRVRLPVDDEYQSLCPSSIIL